MRILTKITGLLVLVAAVSCAKSQPASEGFVSFELSQDQNLADVTKSNVSEFTTLPNVNDFTITITDAAEAVIAQTKLSEWDSTTPLNAGDYKVTATYGDKSAEGFDLPYFEGEASFTVKGDETVAVDITVALANAIVKVDCSDIFKNYYPEYSFQLMRMTSKLADFAKGETRGAFIDPYRFHLEGTVTTETGAVKSFSTEEYRSQNVATVYTIFLDVDNVGGGSITVTFNDTVQVVELGDIELNE